MAIDWRSCIWSSSYANMSIEYLYTVEINLTFSIAVKSYGFSGKHHFCVRQDYLLEKIAEMTEMLNSLFGECRISDAESDSYICMSFDGIKLKVVGQLGGSYNDNHVNFGFKADQTALKLCADAFGRMLA